MRDLFGGHLLHGVDLLHGVGSVNDALSEFSMTDSVKVGISHELVLDGAGAAKDIIAAVVLADHDRVVETLGEGSRFLELVHKLLSGIGSVLCHCKSQSG